MNLELQEDNKAIALGLALRGLARDKETSSLHSLFRLILRFFTDNHLNRS